jgi:hypothetical protein
MPVGQSLTPGCCDPSGGPEYGNELEYLRTFIRQIRIKIEDDPANPVYLLTDSHIGYRFAETIGEDSGEEAIE